MKIRFDRELLQAAFQRAAMVSPSRSAKPILQNVKIDATETDATITATDLEIGVRVEVEGVEAERPGSVVLSPQRFGAILKEVRDDRLLMEQKGSGVVVQANRSRFQLSTEDPQDFPAVAGFDADEYHEISARTLKELIRRTLFATDTESGRYALGGVSLEFGDSSLTAVATDGRRLAVMEGPATRIGEHGQQGTATIVPARAMQLIERCLADPSQTVQIASRANDVLVKVDDTTIYARLVDGRFPNWRDVLPDTSGMREVPLSCGETLGALRQAAICTSEETRGVAFEFGGGLLKLESHSAEVGKSSIEMVIAYADEAAGVTLDHRFVADFFKVLPPEKLVRWFVKDADSACLLTTEDGYRYVVMPLARDR